MFLGITQLYPDAQCTRCRQCEACCGQCLTLPVQKRIQTGLSRQKKESRPPRLHSKRIAERSTFTQCPAVESANKTGFAGHVDIRTNRIFVHGLVRVRLDAKAAFGRQFFTRLYRGSLECALTDTISSCYTTGRRSTQHQFMQNACAYGRARARQCMNPDTCSCTGRKKASSH